MAKITLVDPQFIELKNWRVSKRVRPGAPEPPAFRFCVLFEYGPDSQVRSERIDGYLMTYSASKDDVLWHPPMFQWGKGKKNLIHQNDWWRRDIEMALGFPEANPGWEDGSDPAARQRVENGYYIRFLAKARAWRRNWYLDAAPPTKKALVTLGEEIGEFITGEED